MKKPILVVMAAGMGSRYGGLKQIDPVGSQGEAILDYSLFDAHEAGFEAAVIIIKDAIREAFMETVGARLKNCPMEIRYAYQEVDKLPAGFQVPDGRTKPWGTSHAVLCAKEVIGDAPFAVINADDYYGKEAFQAAYQYLCQAADTDVYDYSMVGYQLCNTVTENGTVARGVCTTDAKNYLTSIVERTKIAQYDGGIHFTEDDGATWTDLPIDTPVSMNFWCFTPSILQELEDGFPAFLENALVENPLKAEYFLPSTVAKLIASKKATVRVLRTPAKWFGVTYAADKPVVVAALQEMTRQGLYPDGLWK